MRHWVESAINWERVVQGETTDDIPNRQLGDYYLGICLFRLGLLQSSIEVFGRIADNRSHLRFAEALPWLALLAGQLPEPGEIVLMLGKYSQSDIEQFNKTGDAALKPGVNYWYGRGRYGAGQHDEALAALQKVDKQSKYYILAQFFIGASYARKRQSVPAIHAFQRAIVALDKSPTEPKDPQRLRDLANLSLARIYYSGAIRLNPETNVPTVGEESLNVAFKYWNKVSQDGEYWLDAQYEQAWAYFMAGDYSGALGTVHTIRSPFVDEWQYPEVDILKSVIYFANCSYEAAMISTARFNQRFMPITMDLDKLLMKYKKRPSEALIEHLRQLRDRKTQLGSELVGSVWFDREFLRNYESVQVIDNEQRCLAQLPSMLSTSNLGKRLRAVLVDARHRFVAATASRAMSYFGDFITRIHEMARDGQMMFIGNWMSANSPQDDSLPVVDAFVPSKARDRSNRFREVHARTDGTGVNRPANPGVGSKRQLSDAVAVPAPVVTTVRRPYGVVTTDDDHIRWPFDGEYWRDELGTYRQTIMSTCGSHYSGLRNLL